MEYFEKISAYIPFVGLLFHKEGDTHTVTRIIEMIIIVMVFGWVTLEKNKTEIAHIRTQISINTQTIEKRMDRIENKLDSMLMAYRGE